MNWNSPELRENFIYRALVCLGLGLLCALLILTDSFQKIDTVLVNQMIWIRNAIHSPSPSENLITVAVDKASITPGTSIFSAEWNHGGWLTRNNWIVGLDLIKDYHKPRVMAWNVGIHESPSQTTVAPHPMIPPDSFERIRQLQSLIQSGNQDLQKKLWEITERRQLSMEAPLPVIGVDLIPLTPVERSITQAAARELLIKTVIQSCRIPEGCVHGKFKTTPKLINQIDLRLPPQEILAAPILVGFNLTSSDPDQIPLIIPLAHQENMHQIIYVPTLTLVSFLASKEITIKGIAPFGAGTPSLQIIPGRFIQIQKGSEIIEIPIDNTGSMRANPRRPFSEITPTSFTTFLEDGLIAAQRPYENRQSPMQGKTLLLTKTFDRESLEKSEQDWMGLDMLLRQDFLKKLDPFFQGVICITISLLCLITCSLVPPRRHTLGFLILWMVYIDAVIILFAAGGLLIPFLLPLLIIVAAERLTRIPPPSGYTLAAESE